jgi:hypothetical protein
MKKTQNGFIVPLTVVILALVVGGSSYIYLRESKIPTKPISNSTPIDNVAINSSESKSVKSNNVDEKASGYIKSAYVNGGKNYIDIDYITFRHEGGDMPWGTIINDNPKIRTFGIASDVKIKIINITSDCKGAGECSSLNDRNINFEEFKNIISNKEDVRSGNPWDIIDKDNIIISITENYRS